jgi:hypothetical protein
VAAEQPLPYGLRRQGPALAGKIREQLKVTKIAVFLPLRLMSENGFEVGCEWIMSFMEGCLFDASSGGLDRT